MKVKFKSVMIKGTQTTGPTTYNVIYDLSSVRSHEASFSIVATPLFAGHLLLKSITCGIAFGILAVGIGVVSVIFASVDADDLISAPILPIALGIVAVLCIVNGWITAGEAVLKRRMLETSRKERGMDPKPAVLAEVTVVEEKDWEKFVARLK